MFDPRNFDPTGSGSVGAGAIALYTTEDALTTVQGAGYFTGISSSATDVVFLLVKASDGAKIYRVSQSGTAITLSTGTSIA